MVTAGDGHARGSGVINELIFLSGKFFDANNSRPRSQSDYNTGMDVRPKRHWYQFTVGGLLILTTIVSLPLGWYVYERNKALWEEREAEQFHSLIRDATIAAKKDAGARPWKEVEAEFTKAGYRLMERDASEHWKPFLAQENAWTAKDGTKHDLIVAAFRNYSDGSPFRGAAGDVTEVSAGLTADLNLPFADVIYRRTYSPRSSVGICLQRPELVTAAVDFPITKRIEVRYEISQDDWGHYLRSYGFTVKIHLAKSFDKDSEGKEFDFCISSELDPPWDYLGQPIKDGYVFSPKLGEITGIREYRKIGDTYLED